MEESVCGGRTLLDSLTAQGCGGTNQNAEGFANPGADTTRAGVVLLLTATVNTNGCSMLARTDAKTRQDDYAQTLTYYLEETAHPIVLVENSGHDLEFLRRLPCVARALAFASPSDAAAQGRADGKRAPGDRKQYVAEGYGARLELVSLSDNDYPRHLGKGHGEQRAILWALARSRLLNDAARVDDRTWVCKITGRLRVPNLDAVLRVDDPEGRARLATRRPLPFGHAVPSQVFAFRRSVAFALEEPRVDDSQGFHFEKLLWTARARCPSGWVATFPEEPHLVGVCAGDDVPYPS